MKVAGQVALVTGANRGIGLALAAELRRRGAEKVYSGVRDPASDIATGTQRLPVSITDARSVEAAARAAPDVTLLINNAGVDRAQQLVSGELDAIRDDIETNLFGTLAMVRAFAPVLARNSGSAIINILSAASWQPFPGHASYAMSKAAAWSLTRSIRDELLGQNTQVTAVHVGLVDTDLTRGIDMAKLSPQAFAEITLDGFENGDHEVIADAVTREIKSGLGQLPQPSDS